MSDIRQFLRYEIPGYILIIYTFLLILPFIKPSVIKESLWPVLLQISISGFIIAIPIGWLLYQICIDSVIEKHYDKKSVKLIKQWIEEKDRSLLEKHCYGELLYVILFSSKNETENKNEDIPFDSQLAVETLRGYWAHYEARRIIAIPVVIISLLLALFVFFIGWQVKPSLFHFNYFWIFIVNLMIICIISSYLFRSCDRIWKEINAIEEIFVRLRKNQIDKIINKICKENNFDKTLK